MNLKKLFASFSIVALLAMTIAPITNVMAATVPAQYTSAYEFAKDNGLTTMPTFEKFNFYGNVSREAFAKFSTKTLEKMGANEVKNSETACSFSDLNAGDSSLKASVVKACQYGLMGINSATNAPADTFNPKSKMTRGQTLTVISRMLDGSTYNGWNPYWLKHETNLYNKWVVTKQHPEVNANGSAVRGYSVIMLMRAVEKAGTTTTTCTDGETLVEGECVDLSVVCEDATLAPLFADICNDLPETCEAGYTMENGVCVEDENPIVLEGKVEFKLSPNTPKPGVWEKVPGGSTWVPVAKYVMTAGANDINITNIELLRKGQSDKDTLEGVALLLENGERLTNVKNEDSEGYVKLSIKGGYTLKAGESVTFDIIVNVWDSYNADGSDRAASDTFQFVVSEVNSSAADVEITTAASELYTVSTQDAPTLTIEEDSSVSDVKVGENKVEIAKFKIEQDDDNAISIERMIFKNEGSADLATAASNFVLEIDDREYATTNFALGDYLSFVNNDNFEIEEDKSLEVVVYADINWEITETLLLIVDDSLDVTSSDVDGYGVAVEVVGGAADVLPNSSDNRNEILIDAGAVILDELENNMDEIQTDKDDAVLGKFTITVNDGSDLYYDDIRMSIETDDNSSVTNISDFFSNVRIYNETTNDETDLDLDTASTSKEYYEADDLESELKLGVNVFSILVDTENLKGVALTDFVGANFTVTFDDIGATSDGGFTFFESSDDERITDITPGTLQLDSVEGVDSSFSIDVLSMDAGTPFQAVRWTNRVPVAVMDIRAGSISEITIKDLVLRWVLGWGALSTDDDDGSTQTVTFMVNDRTKHLAANDTYDAGTTYRINLNDAEIKALSTNHSSVATLATYFYDQLNATNPTNDKKATMDGVEYYNLLNITEAWTDTCGNWVDLAWGWANTSTCIKATTNGVYYFDASSANDVDFVASENISNSFTESVSVAAAEGAVYDITIVTTDTIDRNWDGDTTDNWETPTTYVMDSYTNTTAWDWLQSTSWALATVLKQWLDWTVANKVEVATVDTVLPVWFTVTDNSDWTFTIKDTYSDFTVTTSVNNQNAKIEWDITDDYITRVEIFKGDSEEDITDANRVDTSSDIEDGLVNFDDLETKLGMILPKNTTYRYIVTVDLVNDIDNVWDFLSFGYYDSTAEDADKDDVEPAVTAPRVQKIGTDVNTSYLSDRAVEIMNYGKIFIAVDNTDTSTRTDKNIIGGATSDWVASFELRSENEEVTLQDVKLTRYDDPAVDEDGDGDFGWDIDVDGDGVVDAEDTDAYNGANPNIAGADGIINVEDYSRALTKVVIYAEDKTTVLAEKGVNSMQTLTIENVDYKIDGTQNIYVKVIAKKQGRSDLGVAQGVVLMGGAMKIEIVTAKGSNTLTDGYMFGDVTDGAETYAVTYSKQFNVLPVNLTTVEVYAGDVTSVIPNAEQKIGYLKVTTDTSDNNRLSSTTHADLVLRQIGLVVGNTTAAAVKLRRVDGSIGDITINSVGTNTYPNATYLDMQYTNDYDGATATPTCTNNVAGDGIANCSEYADTIIWTEPGTEVVYEIIATVANNTNGVSVSLNSENVLFTTDEDSTNDEDYSNDTAIGAAYTPNLNKTSSYTVKGN